MASATEAYHRRIAVVFDFDLTLAPGALDALLHRCGQDPEQWKDRYVRPCQEEGWEEILATIHALVRLSESGGGPRITRTLLEEVGRGLQPYEGVPEIFGSLRRIAKDVLPEIELSYFLVSSGYRDVMCATSIAHEFKAIWGTELHFDNDGALDFPKLILTHPEKVRYILALSKGLDPQGANAPAHVYRDVPDAEVYVPLDQMIYVGDGRSDMSAFRLMSQAGGLAIGLSKPGQEEWNGRSRMDAQRRVQNLAQTDFTEGSELVQSLSLAVGSLARKVALRRFSLRE